MQVSTYTVSTSDKAKAEALLAGLLAQDIECTLRTSAGVVVFTLTLAEPAAVRVRKMVEQCSLELKELQN